MADGQSDYHSLDQLVQCRHCGAAFGEGGRLGGLPASSKIEAGSSSDVNRLFPTGRSRNRRSEPQH